MKILLISQYFPPDIAGGANRIGDTYRLLKEKGHDVHVITAMPHKGVPGGALEARLENDEVIRIEVNPLRNKSVLTYLRQYFGFVIKAFIAALKQRKSFKYDVVWATSPPLFMAICTIPLRLITRVPVVLDIRDIWPESAVNIGKIGRGSLLERFGRYLEHAAYRYSDALTCVSVPMRDYIAEMTKRDITVIYNGVPSDGINHELDGDPDPNLFCYAGNLGYAQNLEGLLIAFAIGKENPSFLTAKLRLIGTGALEGDLKKLTSDLNISQYVEFTGVKPKQEAIRLMKQAGTLLIPLAYQPAFEITVPSKVFDCMGLGRPIIASIVGEGKEILNTTGANIIAPPEDSVALSREFLEMHNNWNHFYRLAANNIGAVSEKYTREAAVNKLDAFLGSILSNKTRD